MENGWFSTYSLALVAIVLLVAIVAIATTHSSLVQNNVAEQAMLPRVDNVAGNDVAGQATRPRGHILPSAQQSVLPRGLVSDDDSSNTNPNQNSTCGGHGQAICPSSYTQSCDAGLQHCSTDNRCWYCCGDGTQNNRCGVWSDGTSCSANPYNERYDADCTVTCPSSFGQTSFSGVHSIIESTGRLYNAHDSDNNYDDSQFIELINSYWDTSGDEQWGHGWLAGYVVYTLGRVALQSRESMSPYATALFDCLINDAVNTPVVYYCGGKGNSCTEEAIGSAFTYATADAWHGNTDYRDSMKAAIQEAFSTTTATTGKIYLLKEDGWTKMYNHNSENPVYAVAMMGHVHHMRKIYEEAGLTFPTLDDSTTQNIEDLYAWVQTKIVGSEFATSGCLTADGEADCPCNDDVKAINGHPACGYLKRSTQQYPLTLFLTEEGITNTNPFPTNGCTSGQAGYNEIFNCKFI